MEVLKDASATAIYGARGANGVILITTKQGKSGKTQIDYNGYVGAQTILNQLDFWDGPEYAEYTREAYRNTSNSAIRYNSDVASRDQDLVCPGYARPVDHGIGHDGLGGRWCVQPVPCAYDPLHGSCDSYRYGEPTIN